MKVLENYCHVIIDDIENKIKELYVLKSRDKDTDIDNYIVKYQELLLRTYCLLEKIID